MADVRVTSRDPELEALQEEWGPKWCIWRAQRRDDRPGELLATRRPREQRGLACTIMEPTAAELDAALRQEQG